MSHQNNYELPPAEQLRELAIRQDAKEKEVREARIKRTSSEHQAAAELIQRNYRGYRARREIKGYSLSPSQRWAQAIKDAKYNNTTRPVSNTDRSTRLSESSSPTGNSAARDKWRRVNAIAQRAGGDNANTSETDEEVGLSREEREEYRKKREDRERHSPSVSKTMGLQYFLEMVDHKHRYGSNLRHYHQVWQGSGTTENFFYWLDYGEGKDVDLEDRPRTRLDEERVRYLSKEERKRYLVTIDKEGMLCWAKNGERINTSPDYKDSMDGIVPVSDDTTPTWRGTTGQQIIANSSGGSNDDSSISVGSGEDAARYTNQELHDAKGLNKVRHISAGSVMNSLLRKTTKKNTWIFAADTSFRMYIGIKQSGAFQHSSFFQGGRVAAAGLIRIKRGQLRRLSPLSGHYAPPAKNFRHFVHSLKEAGADMSHVSISRSYAVLVGLEGYLGAKSGMKKGEQHVKDMLNPAEARKREEKERDMSNSAQRERAFLEAQETKKRQQSVTSRMMKKLDKRGEKQQNDSPA